MRYILDHTCLFDANPFINIIPLTIMVFTLVYCITKITRMKKQLREEKEKITGELAQYALDNNEENKPHSIIDDIIKEKD